MRNLRRTLWPGSRAGQQRQAAITGRAGQQRGPSGGIGIQIETGPLQQFGLGKLGLKPMRQQRASIVRAADGVDQVNHRGAVAGDLTGIATDKPQMFHFSREAPCAAGENPCRIVQIPRRGLPGCRSSQSDSDDESSQTGHETSVTHKY